MANNPIYICEALLLIAAFLVSTLIVKKKTALKPKALENYERREEKSPNHTAEYQHYNQLYRYAISIMTLLFCCSIPFLLERGQNKQLEFIRQINVLNTRIDQLSKDSTESAHVAVELEKQIQSCRLDFERASKNN